ncbi:MAG TPA: diacylglycerol kinase family protein [Solirubrobacteraceae bacterium]|nr:diacylglycerol kinase family protein [Solirubrobacteraceae bacterium]
MAAATLTDPLERLEAALGVGTAGPRRRMLVIVNPYATTVSDRLKNLVVYALGGSYEVTAIETQARDHATELCREAASEGYDVVVAFGGDGTVNEAVNGLAGTGTPLTCLPGGRANVYCRMLGIPIDVVDATEHLLRIADAFEPRLVDLGRLNDRYFAFSAGVGLDADVVEKVDAKPRLKARLGEWFYTWTALRTFHRRYLFHPPRLEALVDSEKTTGITAIVQNGSPYTYFGDHPVRMAQGTELDSGALCGIVLERASVIDLPTIVWRALSERVALPDHRRVRPLGPIRQLHVRSCDTRPLPLQVDGDYIGEAAEAAFSLQPRGLAVVS